MKKELTTREYFQSFCESIGNFACYALCIIDIAKKINKCEIDEIQALKAGINKGFIKFNFDDYSDNDNFYVINPDKFLQLLTNKLFTVTKENSDYKIKENEYAVEFWSRNSFGHFARVYDNFNSLQKSNCVNCGEIKSYRIFREVI